MKLVMLMFFQVMISSTLVSQTVDEELIQLGVFKEKVVYEWLKGEEIKDGLPYVLVDRQIKPKRFKYIDPAKVKRIEKVDTELANHLFGEKAQNGVFKIIIDEETNKDSYFKVITNSAYHSSCKSIEGKEEKKNCTDDYLKKQLNDKIGNQDEFVLQIGVDYNGNISDIEIRKGESNKQLNKLFKKWKEKKLDWYPGIQRDFFVNQYVYFTKTKN